MMNSRLKPIIVSIGLAGAHPAIVADIAQSQVEETGQVSSSIEANALTALDRVRARLWGLSEAEWQRYTQLMHGVRGSISQSTISPIEVLGIHARDAAERRRYADAWARAMHEDADRILAFQRAYDAAAKRLYPNQRLIDVARLPRQHAETRVFQSQDRLLLFARPECPACDVLMRTLMMRLDDISGLDIYLTGIAPGNDAAVRAWASRHRIDPEWVRSRRITLNHDGGALDELTKGAGEAPYVLRRRGEELSQIRASDL